MIQISRWIRQRWRSVLTPGTTLRQQVIRGGFWSLNAKVAVRSLSFARTIVLARLLAPEDFGLFGIATLALGALESLTRSGFRDALIQRKDATPAYLNTAWVVQIIRGLSIAVILFVGSPLIAGFFDAPTALNIIRALSISIAIAALSNVGIVFFWKDLDFRRHFVFGVSSALSDAVVAIVAAILLESVWALVFGSIAGSITRLVMSYTLHPFRPEFRFEKDNAVELIRFGRWLFAGHIVWFLVTNGDDIFLGKLLGTEALGVYRVAYAVAVVATSDVAGVIDEVMFPAYSKIQEDLARLGRGFLRVVDTVVSLTLPIVIGFWLFAGEFVLIVLGPKWEAAIVPLQVLAAAGMLNAVANTGRAVYLATGRPAVPFVDGFTRLLVMAIVIYPLTTTFGVVGTALAVVAGWVASSPFWLYVPFGILKVQGRKLVKAVAPAVLAGVVMASIGFGLRVLSLPDTLPGLIASTLVALAGYGTVRGMFGLPGKPKS